MTESVREGGRCLPSHDDLPSESSFGGARSLRSSDGADSDSESGSAGESFGSVVILWMRESQCLTGASISASGWSESLSGSESGKLSCSKSSDPASVPVPVKRESSASDSDASASGFAVDA